MPTIIALDVSASMLRSVDSTTYHQLAVSGINQFLDYLNFNSKMEYVSLVSKSLLVIRSNDPHTRIMRLKKIFLMILERIKTPRLGQALQEMKQYWCQLSLN